MLQRTSGWNPVQFRELLRYRDMLWFLILRSIKSRYAQSVIGVGWAVVQPLFSMMIFTIVFGRLAKISSDGVPYALFSLCGLVPWTFFSTSLLDASGSLINNSHLLNKVYFPRLVLPIAAVASKLVDFFIAIVMLGMLMVFYRVAPTRGVIMLPVLMLVMITAAAGSGMWLTALAVRYRDVSYSMGFVVQLLMYSAPVVYPVSIVPSQYRLFYALNPMVGVIEGFRSAMLGTKAFPWTHVSIGAASALVILVSGAFYFQRKERSFADVV